MRLASASKIRTTSKYYTLTGNFTREFLQLLQIVTNRCMCNSCNSACALLLLVLQHVANTSIMSVCNKNTVVYCSVDVACVHVQLLAIVCKHIACALAMRLHCGRRVQCCCALLCAQCARCKVFALLRSV